MTVTHDANLRVPFKAKADLNSYQYHFVASEGPASGSVGLVNVASGASGPGPIGVLDNDPKADGEAGVVMHGTTFLRVNACGSTISQGRFLTCGSLGHGEPVDYEDSPAGSSYVAHAIALDYTTEDDILIEAFISLNMNVMAGS